MKENIASSPIFANRYRFQPVTADWDVGRSGFTHLVFDMKKERLGVIKRAELKSQSAVEGLKNEVAALLDLKGQGVPEVYDTGEAEYGSKTYFYMVIEYIEGVRVEKNLDSLPAVERAEILTQFFDLLAKTHRMGIVNGDVDLKHLFWRRDKKQLIVIDWGNAKLDVDPKKKTEFAYDLARSAEIVYSFVTRKGHPPATGSLALPANSALYPGITSVPDEFRNLCKWAPRTPADGAQSPHTAQELFEAAKNWLKSVGSAKPDKKRSNWGMRLLFAAIIVAAIYFGISPNSPLYPILFPQQTPTAIPVVTDTSPPPPTETEAVPTVETLSPTATSEEATLTPTLTETPTSTPEPVITPSPLGYADPILIFDNAGTVDTCWLNETNSSAGLTNVDGFGRRSDGNWRFGVNRDQPTSSHLQTDFSSCLADKRVSALALNVWVARLELERNSPDQPGTIDPGKEFGVFFEDSSGARREYTLWVDRNNSIHLRVRNDGEIVSDDIVLVVNEGILKIEGAYPRLYAIFPIQVFLEIDNQGLDIIYLRQGPVQKSVSAEDMDPSQMLRIDKAVLPTWGTAQKIGLIGYGGDTQTVIWPLAFYGE